MAYNIVETPCRFAGGRPNRLSACWGIFFGVIVRIRCYLDGLNFYYLLCRGYGIKWIDLEKLFRGLLISCLNSQDVCIERIILFTSDVKGDDSKRQKIYFSALQAHCSIIEFMKGKIVKKRKSGKDSITGETRTILTREEKQTDVNIACTIVDDAHIWSGLSTSERQYDLTCLISNDSDLSHALKIKKRLKQRILLISPMTETSKSRIPASLKENIAKKDRTHFIPLELVKNSLLPNKVGDFTSPKSWRF